MWEKINKSGVFIAVMVVAFGISAYRDLSEGHESVSTVLFAKEVDLATQTAEVADWVQISKHQYFGLYVELLTDSTFFIDALGGDSLNFAIKYELHPGIPGQPTQKPGSGATIGYRDKTTLALETIMSFTIADTTYTRSHETSTSSGPVPFTPGYWIRFHIIKDQTDHINNDLDIKANITLFQQ